MSIEHTPKSSPNSGSIARPPTHTPVLRGQKSSISSLLSTPTRNSSGKKSPATKKLQSLIKGYIVSFGKCIKSWLKDIVYIQQVVSGLFSLYATISSIRRAVKSQYTSVIINNILTLFPSIEETLITSIYVDIEDVLINIKHTLRGLGDVIVAMKMIVGDCIRITVNEDPDVLSGDDDIFNTQHVLQMQSMYIHYELEYNRIETLLDPLFQINGSNNGSNSSGNNETVMQSIVSSISTNQCIDDNSIKAFVIVNNIDIDY